ncbi:glycosyltransferase family 2 protein [Campylobacter sp. RM9344]|uniref:Glycosyltransferase family 2 protein n=1 Tax=Campylobacter californiensis TaxID=1032243 RepID=A0AAW3ZU04_9BACT|nr:MULTISPECIES: glycosyltransferase family 2 protein [unclassified Campylobacter]MBE2984329.1 glycosyltransferase family 2 protein [Campylobacter sp. RM6883]MBE2985917.1 glycosyltransferase family 2 protein [Campylobacter sp. RM12919]MBE2988118.1 glycosyltransferase family 2 protein [Campylobacter sp. RM12920]MBE2994804.1 glycosyltransferase family 2 protein [Campylobacter sp. RM6913]MBE3029420.1 glycosyltransferase family 2 protein [Campylobacter sp. RM9344]
MIKASVYIICKNEEKHIRRVLESVKDFDQVVIVDSGSTDDTLNIAKSYTDKIYHRDFTDYADQKEYAKNLCKNEWVLNLDADEELSSGLKNEIEQTIVNNDADGIEVLISSMYLGSFNKYGRFIKRIRFFKKDMGSYPKKLVHESINFNGRVKKSKNFIYDYGSNEISTHINKINSYSGLRAVEKFEKNKKSSFLKLAFLLPIAFFKSYFIRRNFLNGKKGLIVSINLAFYAFLKEAKLYEFEILKK